MAYYVNNNELKDVLRYVQWHDISMKDSWYDKYLQKFEKLFQRGKIDTEEYTRRTKFVQLRIDMKQKYLDEYNAMDLSHKAEYMRTLEQYKQKFYNYVKKIVVGLGNAKGYHKVVATMDEYDDMVNDVCIEVYEKSSRFDTEMGTSCFCYLTQAAHNNWKTCIDDYIKHRKTVLPMNDAVLGENDEDMD